MKAKPFVEIELDGQVRKFQLEMNGLVALQEKTGLTVEDLNARCVLSPIAVRGVLWAGLQHEEKPPTLEQVGDMIDLAELHKIAPKVIDLINNAFGGSREEQSESEDGDPSKKLPGTGTAPSTPE